MGVNLIVYYGNVCMYSSIWPMEGWDLQDLPALIQGAPLGNGRGCICGRILCFLFVWGVAVSVMSLTGDVFRSQRRYLTMLLKGSTDRKGEVKKEGKKKGKKE